jgi:hypothetical protein
MKFTRKEDNILLIITATVALYDFFTIPFNSFLITIEYSLSDQKICSSYVNFIINKMTNLYKEKPELFNLPNYSLSEEEEVFFKKNINLIFKSEETIEKKQIITFQEYLYNNHNKFIISTVLLSIFMSFISIYIFNTDNKKLKLF